MFSSLNSPVKATHVEHKRKLEVMKEIFFYGKLMTFTVKTRSSKINEYLREIILFD